MKSSSSPKRRHWILRAALLLALALAMAALGWKSFSCLL